MTWPDVSAADKKRGIQASINSHIREKKERKRVRKIQEEREEERKEKEKEKAYNNRLWSAELRRRAALHKRRQALVGLN